jgi:hypothetical protein
LYQGPVDPRSLTAGARGPRGQATLAKSWSCHGVPASSLARAARRRGTREAGKRPSRTGGSPGSHLRCRPGRRRADGGGIDGGGARVPGGETAPVTDDGGLGRWRARVRRQTCRGATAAAGQRRSERRRRRDGSVGQPAGVYLFSAHFSLAVSAIWGRRWEDEGRVIYVGAIGPGSFHKPQRWVIDTSQTYL